MERTPQPLVFPLGGLDRSLSFQTQPPYSTTDALNVLPQDGVLERARGGLRPGMSKYSSNAWGSRFRCLNVYSNIDGIRSLIGATVSGGVSYASIAGGTASNGAVLNTTGRVQCVQYGDRVYFTGDDVQTLPVYAEYNTSGTVTSISTLTVSNAPSVAFPTSTYPRCVAVKYNRLWLSWNGTTSGSQGFASRYWASKVGDDLNFEDDAGLANTDAFSAELNTDRTLITAMIPWYDNYMVFTTGTTSYVLTGDPRKGGIMRQVSGRFGIIDCASWTIGEDNTIYAMSASGPIMLTPQNPFGEPTLMMKDKLPGTLSRPDTSTVDYTFAYDSRSRRVYIFCPARSAVANVDHWVLDLRTKSLWPIRFASTNHEPFACVQIKEIASERSDLLLGCRDGYLRYWNEVQATDDGTNISSYVMLGPFRIDEEHDCRICELLGTLATSSGRVVVSLHVGSSAQAAYAATAVWSNSWTAGRNYLDRPRIRGGVFYVKISGTAGARWEFEHALAKLSRGGKLRL